ARQHSNLGVAEQSLNCRPQNRKRQWGAERKTQPLPSQHERPSDRKIALGRVAIVVTVVFWLVCIIYTIMREFLNNIPGGFRFNALVSGAAGIPGEARRAAAR
ncbi:MAG: hypothetical protein ABWX59_02600, partial [Microbacteriaceae bacterium]